MADLGHGKDYKFVKNAVVGTGQLITYETHPTFSADTEVVDKKYVDDAVATEDLWDKASNTLSPKLGTDIVSASLTDALEQNIFQASYTVNSDAVDSFCYVAQTTSSVATTSGQKVGFKAEITPNVGDTTGTTYVGFFSDDVSGTPAIKIAFQADAGYTVAFAALSGARIDSVSSLQSIAAAIGITDVKWKNILAESSTAGDTTITANPAIASLSTVGQSIRVIGTDDTKTVTLNTGNGLSLDNGLPVTLGLNDTIDFVYIGTTWLESRRCIKA